MKDLLRKIFSPILRFFEGGNEDFSHNPSHRKILLAVGALFILLTVVVGYFLQYQADKGFYFPIVLFFVVGCVCLIVGGLGSDKAVARIWGNRK